jgi:hypothetical protein
VEIGTFSAIVRLQGFSSCSPAAFPHHWAVWWGEASRAVASTPPSASRILVILDEVESELSWGVASAWAGNPFLPQCLGEKGILQPCGGFVQPCRGRRTAASWIGCSVPSFIRVAVAPRTGRLRPGLPRAVSHARGLPSTSRAARAVLVFWSSLGGGRSEDLPVRFGAAGACWCGVGGQVDAVVDAVVAAAGEGFSADEIVGASCASSLWLFCFNGWFSSSREGTRARAFHRWHSPWGHRRCRRGCRRATRSSSSRRPSDVGGCSYPREWNRSPVCNGTLSASVCSWWLLRPEHLGIRDRSCASSSFRALGLVCWLAEPLNRASVAFRGR